MNFDTAQRAALAALEPVLMPLIRGLARGSEPPANSLSQHIKDTLEAFEVEDELELQPVITAMVVDQANADPDQVRELIDQLGRYPDGS